MALGFADIGKLICWKETPMMPPNQNPHIPPGVAGVQSIRRQAYRNTRGEDYTVYLYQRSGFTVGPDGVLYALDEVAASEPLQCGCHPRDIRDIGVCRETNALVCRALHGASCSVCGGFFSSPYLSVRHSGIDDRRLLVCHRCLRAIETTWWDRLLEWLNGLGGRHG